jgi:hypothetical protein
MARIARESILTDRQIMVTTGVDPQKLKIDNIEGQGMPKRRKGIIR